MKIILRLVLLICLGIIGLFLIIQLFFNDMCTTSILKKIPSPDKQLQAIIFQMDCGATTGFNRHVTIIPIHSTLTTNSNSFFVMDNNKGNLDLNIIWHSNTNLEIQYPQTARIFRAEKNADAINIVYRSKHL